jgi:hypothetical protein
MNTFLGAVYLLQKFKFVKVPGEQYSMDPITGTEVVHFPRPYKLGLIPHSDISE